ncbi:MAG: hypothetical protein J5485_00230 [Candidatus Methanomethylophilaceae archaeon]|nr:hypothetical protein [Candidatus Methanomethylophilaceae archaeon]
MMTVTHACEYIVSLAADLEELACYRLQGAPVDDEILAKVSEVSHAIDAIRDRISEGEA